MRPRVKRLFFFAPLAVLGMVAFIAIGGVVVQQLWNWLLPQIFGWRLITFWQAIGFLVLCRILFGGFGFRGSGRSRMGNRMRQHWARMSPEEREAFRRRMRERCGFEPYSGGAKEQ